MDWAGLSSTAAEIGRGGLGGAVEWLLAGGRSMWERLDHPQISEMALQNCRPKEAPALAALLGQASIRPWAADLCAVTSLGHLHLTTQRAYDDKIPAGCIHLSVVESGKIELSYSPPHSAERAVGRIVAPDDALRVLELMLIQLFEDHAAQGAEVLSTDKDPERPRFKVGSQVRVIQNERNRTPREGVVVRHIWHHKFKCWTYFIEEGGKKVKKRYLGEDLES